jgi:hypothetical protein
MMDCEPTTKRDRDPPWISPRQPSGAVRPQANFEGSGTLENQIMAPDSWMPAIPAAP